MSEQAASKSRLVLLLRTGLLFAVFFWVLVSLLDVAFGSDLSTALRANIDNAIIVTSLWMGAMWLLGRRRA